MLESPWIAGVALAAASVAALTDVRSNKVYNWLTLPLLAAAPLLQYAVHGPPGLLGSVLGAGCAIAGLILLSLAIGGGFGGGDLKLLIAMGALLAWPSAGWLLLWTGLAGALLALPILLRRGIFLMTCTNLGMNLLRRRSGERDLSVSAGSHGPKLPYAVAILIGAVMTLWWTP